MLRRSIEFTQYLSDEYTGILKSHEFQISCSAKGNPYGNAFVESFMKTLKRDEVYLKKYRTYLDVIDNLPRFIEDVYNRKRLHSGLDYCPPEEYENKINQGASRTKLKL